MSLLGRREGLPARTVLILVEHRPGRGSTALRRLLLLLAMVVLLAVAVVAAVAILRGRSSPSASTPPTPSTPAAPRPKPPRLTPAERLAASQQQAITRLAGLGLPVFCGSSHSRDVALTFDDGPGRYTAQILAVLRRHHAQATFFLVGNRVRYWPRLPAAEARLGTLGDHTWSHADLSHLPRRAARLEIARARWTIGGAARTSVRLFRIPYGREPAWLGRYLAARNMLEIRWSVESRDYLTGTTPAAIVRRVSPGLRPGAIVLLHDIHPATLRALPRLLALLRARHLHAVSVPELLRADAPTYPQLMADSRGRGCVDLATAGRE